MGSMRASVIIPAMKVQSPYRVGTVDLPQIRENGRSKRRSESPRKHHQPKDRANVPRSKIIRGERRSDAISAAVTHHENECRYGQNPNRRDPVVRPEEYYFREIHQKIGDLAIGDVGDPRPKYPPKPVTNANNAHQTRGGSGCRFPHFLEDGSSLRHDREPRHCIDAQQQADCPPLPFPQSLGQCVIAIGALQNLRRARRPSFRVPAFGEDSAEAKPPQSR